MALSINDNVFIKIFNTELVCKVIRIEYDRIFLALPLDKMNILPFFKEGREVELKIQSNEEGVIVSDALILSVTPHGIFEIDYCDEDSSREITQRRAFVRVYSELDLELFINGKTVTGVTINISGNGIKFKCYEDLPQKANIYGRLIIDENIVAHMYGKIFKKDSFKKNEYVYHFTNIDDKELTKIIKYNNSISAKRIKNN